MKTLKPIKTRVQQPVTRVLDYARFNNQLADEPKFSLDYSRTEIVCKSRK